MDIKMSTLINPLFKGISDSLRDIPLWEKVLEYISQESPIKVDDWLPIRIYIYSRGQFLVVKLYMNNGLTLGVTY